ncbi:MAG: GTPase Era [Deltaproteobacteria bacterium]|nr:GTPase Era [Deltaproteobacteria bacterium]
MSNPEFKSGFITLAGRPNVGKSTLLNQLVGQHVSITSKKPQTTRNRIRGILNGENYQAVILDTPGIHLPKSELHKRIVAYAVKSLPESDLIFFMTEALPLKDKEISKEDLYVINSLPKSYKKTALIINKTDLCQPEQLLRTIEIYNKAFDFFQTVPISAKKAKGIDNLLKIIQGSLRPGVAYFPIDQYTDQPERLIVSELIREQLIKLCWMEVPYGLAVAVESFKETDKLIKIYATIFVEKQTHKKIVIGSKGEMLKTVGTGARKKIEAILAKKVFLSLHVKVSANWVNNPRKLGEFGYGTD